MFKLTLVIFTFLNSFSCLAANYLDLYINPAASKLNWESPRALIKSYINTTTQQAVSDTFTSVSKSTVGHAMLRYHCVDSSGKMNDFFTGMSGQESLTDATDLIINQKAGAKVLFAHFEDGYIEDSDEVRNLIAHHYARTDTFADGTSLIKKPKFLRFTVNQKQCDQAVDVYETFKDVSFGQAADNLKTLSAEKKIFYGLDFDAYKMYLNRKINPNAVLGSACTSFVVAILKAAGVYDQELDHFWMRNISISIDKLGEINPSTGQRYEFPFTNFFDHHGKAWATDGLPTKSFSFYEPEKMWNFIHEVSACSTEDSANKCDPKIQSWMNKQKSFEFKPVQNIIIGDYERTIKTVTPRGVVLKTEIEEYEKEFKIEGVQISQP